jgi:hypothetical protein
VALRKGLALVVVAAGDAEGVWRAFERTDEERPRGLVVVASGFTWKFRNEIIRETRRLKIPWITSALSRWSGG